MSWKNIKTFLILLFIIINAYLIISTGGSLFKKSTVTYIKDETVSDVLKAVKANYNVSLKKSIVPKKIINLKNIDVTNIIYTDTFKNSGYDFSIKGAGFEATIATNTFSYNETNAPEQVREFVKKIGISDNTYTLKTKKTDLGLVCTINQSISDFPVFSGLIKAVCVPNKITVTGAWYITNPQDEKTLGTSVEMRDITSVIIDAADKCHKSDGSPVKITDIDYGYCVTSYDENVVSKSSPAIPCYRLKTDEGLKYYYDATNGKPIKQED